MTRVSISEPNHADAVGHASHDDDGPRGDEHRGALDRAFCGSGCLTRHCATKLAGRGSRRKTPHARPPLGSGPAASISGRIPLGLTPAPHNSRFNAQCDHPTLPLTRTTMRNVCRLTVALGVATLAAIPATTNAQRADSAARGGGAARGAELPLKPARTVRFTTDEGTWMSARRLARRPDARLRSDAATSTRSPIAGGKATRITDGLPFDAQPRWSPDGKTIVYVTDRDGSDDVWVMDADGKNARQITKTRPHAVPVAGVHARRQVRRRFAELGALRDAVQPLPLSQGWRHRRSGDRQRRGGCGSGRPRRSGRRTPTSATTSAPHSAKTRATSTRRRATAARPATTRRASTGRSSRTTARPARRRRAPQRQGGAFKPVLSPDGNGSSTPRARTR